MKKLIPVLMLLFSGLLSAQTTDENLVKECITKLFSGMKNADETAILQTLTEKALLQTITKNGDIKDENVKTFASEIAKIGKDKIAERIEFKSVQIDGNLASVFTPYQFYYEGKFVHCGANSFQLVKKDGAWKIQYLIDTRRKENCQ